MKKSLEDETADVLMLITWLEAVRGVGLPAVLPAAGLSLQRMEYLHKSIQSHVPAEFQDELCPRLSPLTEAEPAGNDEAERGFSPPFILHKLLQIN